MARSGPIVTKSLIPLITLLQISGMAAFSSSVMLPMTKFTCPPFYFLITASVINIILDAILILGMGLGVEGAGIATWLSQGISVLLCIWFIKKKMQILIPKGEERKFDNKKISILLNNGVPMGLQFSITAIGLIMLQSANNALGTVYVAAFTASMRIKYLFTCVFENIGVAMATYCGQNLGARKLDRIGQGVRASIRMMLVYFVFTFLLIYPFADEMMMLFVDKGEAEVVTYAAQFMRIANYFYPCLGLLTILRYSIQGLERGLSLLRLKSGEHVVEPEEPELIGNGALYGLLSRY